MPPEFLNKYPEYKFLCPVINEKTGLDHIYICYLQEWDDYRFIDVPIIETFNSTDGTIVFGII